MRHIFIINPVAGRGKGKDLANTIDKELKNKNIEYEIYITNSKEDLVQYVNDKCNEQIQSVIYSCGGDGTIHHIVNETYGYKHISVGIIPCGSGNDFVKNFNDKNNFHNIQSQLQGKIVYLDLIRVNKKLAVSVCNIGLDADAAHNMNKFRKIPFISGPSKYILALLFCIFKKLGKDLEIITDNNKFHGNFLLGVVANGHSYGGGYKCAPLANIKDGLLDLCFVNKISRFKILNLLGVYKEGKHLEDIKIKNQIIYKKCTNVTIKSNEPLNICIDGESYLYDKVGFSVERNALRFWIPKGVTVQG